MTDSRVIDLEEYVPKLVSQEDLPETVARFLHDTHGSKVLTESPSFQTGGQWRLTSQGWVGHIPLPDDHWLQLRPKTPVANILGMMEYAYKLNLNTLKGFTKVETLEQAFSSLARILALRTLDRVRRGLYRSYVSEIDRLPYVRGRILVTRRLRQPHDPLMPCSFETHTPDIDDNQILVWTFQKIIDSGLCRDQDIAIVRRAARALHGDVSATPRAASNCLGRRYNRLNEDYRDMHVLCWFFLAHVGPSHTTGPTTSLPFLINMNRLYEAFVAQWLREHLSPRFVLEDQAKVNVSPDGHVSFTIDLVVSDVAERRPLVVLDTKYKIVDSAASDDVSQVISYAVSKHCGEAVLVYPKTLLKPINDLVGNIRVRALPFSIEDKDLSQGGAILVKYLDSLGIGTTASP